MYLSTQKWERLVLLFWSLVNGDHSVAHERKAGGHQWEEIASGTLLFSSMAAWHWNYFETLHWILNNMGAAIIVMITVVTIQPNLEMCFQEFNFIFKKLE